MCSSIYTCSLTSGVALGIVLSGLISIHNGWRTIYWIFTALNGFVTLLMIFTFPETAFKRLNAIEQAGAAPDDAKAKEVHAEIAQVESRNLHLTIPKKTYFQQLALFSGTHTEESLVLLFFRPCVLLTLPPILWSTLVFAVTTGTNVILSANFATAFQQFYGMNIWQSGLTWIAGFIGCILAIFAGGHISDWIADRFTIRNGGVRHPEMRLPAIVISLILGPLGCVLYGVGIGHHFHWMCPVVGIALGMCFDHRLVRFMDIIRLTGLAKTATFSTVQATNIALVYCLDSYRPIAGESVVTMSAFKGMRQSHPVPSLVILLVPSNNLELCFVAAFGFLLNFYANHWIVSSGYQNSFGAMAGIIAAVLIVALPLYFWGRRIRRATWQWDFIKQLVHWTEDREVGE